MMFNRFFGHFGSIINIFYIIFFDDFQLNRTLWRPHLLQRANDVKTLRCIKLQTLLLLGITLTLIKLFTGDGFYRLSPLNITVLYPLNYADSIANKNHLVNYLIDWKALNWKQLH